MIKDLPKKLGTPERDPKAAFLPFPVAVETNKIDLEDTWLTTPNDAAIAIANGKAPQGGGIFYDWQRHDFGAVDLLAFRRTGSRVIALPSPKDAVEKETYDITSPCGSFWTMPDGRVFISALIESAERAQWMSGYRITGAIGIKHLGLDTQRFELTHTSPSGLMVVKERPLQFSF